MAEHGRAYNEVKELLGKLDRSIDDARDKRLHGDRPEPEPIQPRREPEPRKVEEPNGVVNPPRPGASKYGKARPLRPNNDQPRWRTG